MKNQYVADIGDYGKYSLLRAFEDAGIDIGINWYLTKDDNSNDGSIVKYLCDTNFRKFCPSVYDSLKVIYEHKERNVAAIKKSDIFHSVQYYDEYIDYKDRRNWHEKALKELEKAELIFLDPDNGLLVNDKSRKRDSEKYTLLDEVIDYFERGQNVVYYCHRGRRTTEQWEEYKRAVFRKVPYAYPLVLTYHRGTQRSYVFLIHQKDVERYFQIVKAHLKDWDSSFTYENVDMCMLSDISNGLKVFLDQTYISDRTMSEFLMDNGLVIKNYARFGSSLPLNVGAELKHIENADFERCCALMTMILREDHFDNGSYERRYKEGNVTKIMSRMLSEMEYLGRGGGNRWIDKT